MRRFTGVTDIASTLLPEQKVESRAQPAGGGHQVLLVGDGVNDAPAMAAARAAVAMGMTLQTADGVTTGPGTASRRSSGWHGRRRVVTVQPVHRGHPFIAKSWCCGTFLSSCRCHWSGGSRKGVLSGLNGMRLLTNRSWRARLGLRVRLDVAELTRAALGSARDHSRPHGGVFPTDPSPPTATCLCTLGTAVRPVRPVHTDLRRRRRGNTLTRRAWQECIETERSLASIAGVQLLPR